MLRRTVGKNIKLLRRPNCRLRVSESIGSQRNLDEKMPYAGSPVTEVMLKKGRIDARAVVRVIHVGLDDPFLTEKYRTIREIRSNRQIQRRKNANC